MVMMNITLANGTTILQDVGQSFNYLQGIPFAALINSPWFFIIIAVCLIFIPSGVFGFWNLAVRIRNWDRARSGWIRIRKKLSNYHWIEFWAKPSGRKVKIKGEEGIEFELPIQIENNMMGLEKQIDSSPEDLNKEIKQSEKQSKKHGPAVTQTPGLSVTDKEININKALDTKEYDTMRILLEKQNRSKDDNELLGDLMGRLAR